MNSAILVWLTWWLPLLVCVRGESAGRPDRNDYAGMARWLVSGSKWGVLSTISVRLHGMPFGNVASFSDGPLDNSTGTPYFYLTKLDQSAYDVSKDPRCSLSLSEEPLGTCVIRDAEDPSCARLTLSGLLEEVKSEYEREFAAQALFSKHPDMKSWPKDHHFQFYKLIIENIFLLDWYGGAKPLTVSAYYQNNHVASYSALQGSME